MEVVEPNNTVRGGESHICYRYGNGDKRNEAERHISMERSVYQWQKGKWQSYNKLDDFSARGVMELSCDVVELE